MTIWHGANTCRFEASYQNWNGDLALVGAREYSLYQYQQVPAVQALISKLQKLLPKPEHEKAKFGIGPEIYQFDLVFVVVLMHHQ